MSANSGFVDLKKYYMLFGKSLLTLAVQRRHGYGSSGSAAGRGYKRE